MIGKDSQPCYTSQHVGSSRGQGQGRGQNLRPVSAAGMEGANRVRGRTLTGAVLDIAMQACSCMRAFPLPVSVTRCPARQVSLALLVGVPVAAGTAGEDGQ